MLIIKSKAKQFTPITLVTLLFCCNLYAYNDYYCYTNDNSTTSCCDQTIDDSAYGATCKPFDPDSNLGVHRVKPEKSVHLNLKCQNNADLKEYHYGHSGGSIKCTLEDGTSTLSGRSFVHLNCHNSATKSGHVWIQGVLCETKQNPI